METGIAIESIESEEPKAADTWERRLSYAEEADEDDVMLDRRRRWTTNRRQTIYKLQT